MPKQKYDLNDNGKIDPEERQIMLEDRRRIMIDLMPKGMHRGVWRGLALLVCLFFRLVLFLRNGRSYHKPQ
jgi:hypothetical protein